jgi:hypothetical protein
VREVRKRRHTEGGREREELERERKKRRGE